MAYTLVVGASGAVGSELTRLLTEQGRPVRRTTGKTPKEADQVRVDLMTGEGIENAIEGTERVFLMSPSGYADQYKLLSPLIREAKRRRLQKVVLMSAMGADANDDAPLRKAEIELERSGLPYNIIRPNWFMQNFNMSMIQPIRDQGKILLPAKKAKVSFIDTRDVSAVAARLLVSNDLKDRAFNLTGPEAIDHDRVAALISKATGKRITYQEIQPSDLKAGLLAAGLREDYANFLILLFGFLAEGYNAGVTSDVKLVLGREPIPFSKYAEDYRKAWI